MTEESITLDNVAEPTAEPTRERTRGATPRALGTAIETYARWESERAKTPLDRVVDAEVRSRKYLNSSERRWMSEAVYGAVRFLNRQTFLLERLGLDDTPDNRIRLWIAAPCEPDGTFTRPPADVAALAELVDAERLAAAIEALPGPDRPKEYLRTTLSFPDAIADELEAILGDSAPEAGAALNARPPTTLRVNTIRVGRDRVLRTLEGSSPTDWSPWGVELSHRVNIFDVPGFREGWFETQEEGSQLATLLCGAAAGQLVIDVGAGAGGKTLAMAALMRNEGRIVAMDVSATRLHELRKRAYRAGANHIRTIELTTSDTGRWIANGADVELIASLQSAADVVLVDAPCGGSGTLRRSPDAKWRDVDVATFTRLQIGMLEQAAKLVRPGGALIYVTCAFERSQNEDVIERFLASPSGAEFEVEPAADALAAGWHAAGNRAHRTAKKPPASPDFTKLVSGPHLRTWPHLHGLDAFFGARLRRRET